MLKVECFVFNMFYENSFVVYDDSKKCAVIDPGCYSQKERDELKKFIESKGLEPVLLINTHCHVDHVFGNRFVAETWKLKDVCHSECSAIARPGNSVQRR
jgi:glyoxylase-like metal-dependent hydrolase (beta-lactamase superfamily II)